jgi:hypothetical protein
MNASSSRPAAAASRCEVGGGLLLSGLTGALLDIPAFRHLFCGCLSERENEIMFMWLGGVSKGVKDKIDGGATRDTVCFLRILTRRTEEPWCDAYHYIFPFFISNYL